MGRQGGIARFTGSFGDLNFYFDDDRAPVRWKSRLNRKKWLARREMWRQHDSSRLFGAASVVAAHLWRGLPAGMRRLADGAGYGRLVGRCVELIGEDPDSSGRRALLWDADLLRRLDLNVDALVPSVRFRVSGEMPSAGLGVGIRLEGLDQLIQELDLAMGDSAGAMPASFMVAHGVSPFALGLTGLRLTAEEARVKTAFRPCAGAEEDSNYSSCLTEANDSVGVRSKAGKSLLSSICFSEAFAIPSELSLSSGPECEKARGASWPVQRRFRVWVHGTRVVDPEWNDAQGTFGLSDDPKCWDDGYVTPWEENFQGSVDLQHWIDGCGLRELMPDGEYVVYCAVEVSEKRGRHWVRLPYCCRFEVVDVVLVEDGELVAGNACIGCEESLEAMEQDLERESLAEMGVGSFVSTDAGLDGLVLIEFKGHNVPSLDILRGLGWLGCDWELHGMPLRVSGIRAGP